MKRQGLTLDHVWRAAALILLATRVLLTPIPPHDFWWHMAMGRIIVGERAIPTVDRFSWTQTGQPFFDQSWLAQIVMYGLYALGGPALLLLVQACVIVLAYMLVLQLCVRRTGRLRLSVGVLLLSLPLVFDNWTIRPQSYVFPLFAGTLVVLADYRHGRANRLWLLPILMAVWVNIHGSFVLGLVLIAIHIVGELPRRTENRKPRINAMLSSRFSVLGSLVRWGALAAAATLLNPRGLGVWGYVRDLTSNSAVRTLVVEWSPPSLFRTSDLFFFAFVACSVAVLVVTRRHIDITDLLLGGAFLLLALSAGRNIVWFGFVVVPLLVGQIDARLPAPPARRAIGAPALNAALVALLALLLVAALPWFKGALFPPSVGALLNEETPVNAVRWLQAQPERPQRLFHPLSYGSFLTWAAPQQHVFIDPRIELYPYEQWRAYINFGQGVNMGDTIQQYAFDGMLLDQREQAALIAALRRDPVWVVRYEDAQAVYFAKVTR